MLESIVKNYEKFKAGVKKERAMRELARAIEGSPIESSTTNIPYKTLALFLAPVAAVSCVTSGQEVKQPEVQGQVSQWSKPVPRPGSGFGDSYNLLGERRPIIHNGLDWSLSIGTPVVAAANGITKLSDYYSDGGENIYLRHGGQYYTVHGHLNTRLVKRDDIVFRGMIIAYSGWTGNLRGPVPHLHFGLNVGGSNDNLATDPARYWALGKPYTYDGVTDWDGQARKTGNFLLSAPFAGPVPKGNVNLEQIVKAADVSDDRVKEFLKNPEQYKQQIFESAMALIAKKNRKLAEELAGLPILNDGVDGKEARTIWMLYDALKDVDFSAPPQSFLTKPSGDALFWHGLTISWGAGAKDKYEVRLGFVDSVKDKVGDVSVRPYFVEEDDKFSVSDGSYLLLSNVKGDDRDGFSVYFAGLRGSKIAVVFDGENYVVDTSKLKYGTSLKLRENFEVNLLTPAQRYSDSTGPGYSSAGRVRFAVEDMLAASQEHKARVGNKVYQWNFWLQEVLRQAQEKDLAEVLKDYGTVYGNNSRLDSFFMKLWNLR